MLRKILNIVIILLLTVFVVATLSFSVKESRNVVCRDIEIMFRENELIKISKDEIVRLVKAADNDLIGKELKMINGDYIEKEVEKHQAILNAEVYKVTAKDSSSYSGIIGVKIRHRQPVVRIMSADESYYLDRNSEKIPNSNNYTANVLVVTGFFSEQFAKEQLLPFILFIEDNPFWKAQIEQVHVEKNGDIVLIPLVGNHLIELGPLENLEKKLFIMKEFYKQVLTHNNWNRYEKVSVKYKDQVIAKKR